MSLQTRLQDLITAIGADINTLITTRGTLSGLTTTAKSNLVAAINEVKTIADAAAGGGVSINDAATNTTQAWSSQKINDYVAAAVAALVNSAPGALDTLGELATELGNQSSAAAALTTAVGNRVRFDAAQSLTAPQMVQANANMGSLSLVQSGDPETNLVTLYTAAKA